MATYNVVVRYDNAGTSTDANLTITANAPAEAFVKDGDVFRLTDDSGVVYVIPEQAMIFMSFTEAQ